MLNFKEQSEKFREIDKKNSWEYVETWEDLLYLGYEYTNERLPSNPFMRCPFAAAETINETSYPLQGNISHLYKNGLFVCSHCAYYKDDLLDVSSWMEFFIDSPNFGLLKKIFQHSELKSRVLSFNESQSSISKECVVGKELNTPFETIPYYENLKEWFSKNTLYYHFLTNKILVTVLSTSERDVSEILCEFYKDKGNNDGNDNKGKFFYFSFFPLMCCLERVCPNKSNTREQIIELMKKCEDINHVYTHKSVEYIKILVKFLEFYWNTIIRSLFPDESNGNDERKQIFIEKVKRSFSSLSFRLSSFHSDLHKKCKLYVDNFLYKI